MVFTFKINSNTMNFYSHWGINVQIKHRMFRLPVKPIMKKKKQIIHQSRENQIL